MPHCSERAVADIILTTFNARYIHAAFGLRYLMANLGDLKERAEIQEYIIKQRPIDVAEALLASSPKIIGLGVYIWNVPQCTELVAILKRLAPEVHVVIGGPEVSHEIDGQPICQMADVVITGEADLAFAQLCRDLLGGQTPDQKVIRAPLPDINALKMPYDLYTEEDIAHRVVYVEASRGCPFRCEFCLSSLPMPVRKFPLEPFLAAMDRMIERGLRHFKFVDRTFNLDLKVSAAILEFFLERYQPGMFFHFEMIPDRLPDGLRDIIARFEPGCLQFEVGIQTFDAETSKRISRRQKVPVLEDNLTFLREETGVHVHADLIAGLPGESLESFARGFDRLVALGPQEIQLGLLKRLKGTPIIRHTEPHGMVYAPAPPFEVLKTDQISFAAMQEFKRFSLLWDRLVNSGRFVRTAPLLWEQEASAFAGFMDWSRWFVGIEGRAHSVAHLRLTKRLFEYLTEQRGMDPRQVASLLIEDYRQGGRQDVPGFLRPHLPQQERRASGKRSGTLPSRQQRHQKQSS